MPSKNSLRLKEASDKKLLVRFWNPYDEGSTSGYVLDVGPRFFLLALVGDDIRFNGFQCLLISDVRRLQVPAKYVEFILSALRKRGEKAGRKPRIDLSGISELLGSVNRLFTLVTIHEEKVNKSTCKIGRLMNFNETRLSMLEIGPDAVWETRPTLIRFRDITRVDFGGGYEEALHLVGGSPAD